MFYFRVGLAVLWTLFSSILWIFISLMTFLSIHRFSRSVRFIGKGVLWILGISVKLEGKENFILREPTIILANHQSMLDTFLFGSICPPGVTVIGKKELRYLPLIGWWLWAVGIIFIDRKDKNRSRETIEQTAKAMRERGASIGILPEGTRNLTGRGLLPFKKGAFHLAVATHAPIVMAVCSPLADVANYKNKVLKKTMVTIRAMPPLPTKHYSEDQVDDLLNLCQQKMLETLEDLGKAKA